MTKRVEREEEKEWVPFVGWRHALYQMLTSSQAFVCILTLISSSDPMGHLSQWYYFVALAAYALWTLSTFYWQIRLFAYEMIFFFVGSFSMWAWATFLLWLFFRDDIQARRSTSPRDVPSIEEMKNSPGAIGGIYLAYIHFAPIIFTAFVWTPQYATAMCDYYRRIWIACKTNRKGALAWYIIAQVTAPFLLPFIYISIWWHPFEQYGIEDAGATRTIIVYVTSLASSVLSQAVLLGYLRSRRHVVATVSAPPAALDKAHPSSLHLQRFP